MKWIYKFLIRFIIFTLLFGTFIAISVKFAYVEPSEYIYSDNDWDNFSYSPEYNHSQWNILLDAHSHTYYSDGYLSPRQNILWHISMGFNAMVLTDHNTFDGVEEILELARKEFNDTIKVLRGMEWTTDRGHLNIILPPEVSAEDYEKLKTHSSYSYTPSDEEFKNIIESAHSIGGLIVVNHIPWSEEFCHDQPSREQFLEWGVDYIEIINQETYDKISENFCLENNLGIITGTDMHKPEPVYAWTTLNVSEFSENAIFNELKAKKTGYIYTGAASSYPVEHKHNPAYSILYPFIKMGEIFRDVYSSPYFTEYLTPIFLYPYLVFFSVELSKFVIYKKKRK
ncbi:MAG: PHP domain-containing protein [Candidatus Heimdallarchaeaceae archaeon]